MFKRILKCLKRLPPRFVPYKGWAIDIPDIVVISLVSILFMPILPTERIKGETGFRVFGNKGVIENQYSTIIDIWNDDLGHPDLIYLRKAFEHRLVNPKETIKKLVDKGLKKPEASCISWLFFSSNVFSDQLTLRQEFEALAPSQVPAIWLIRSSMIGVINIFIAHPNMTQLNIKALEKCRKLGIEPSYLPLSR